MSFYVSIFVSVTVRENSGIYSSLTSRNDSLCDGKINYEMAV